MKRIIFFMSMTIILIVSYVSLEKYLYKKNILNEIVGTNNVQFTQLIDKKNLEGIDGGQSTWVYKIKNPKIINCRLLKEFKDDKLIPIYNFEKQYIKDGELKCSKIIEKIDNNIIYTFVSKNILIIKRYY